MDFITTGVIASTVYDLLKNGLSLSAIALRERLGQWIKNEIVADAVADELSKLNLHDGLSEKAISQRLDDSHKFTALIHDINAAAATVAQSTITTVNQTHSGSGDNIAGNKITN